ncbi:MAG: helix-turn-helix domain-containing protein [Kiritimatiellae bacterium]|nr:helix-turn-helix domain-containing protein [Kiritimatiellia bacterium]
MSTSQDGAELSLGARLREARLRRRVTLSEAAEATRIKATQLELMENDQFDRVGAPVYVKGFLRLYGEYLGLDREELVREYLRRWGATRPVLTPEVTSRVVPRRLPPSPELAPPTDLVGEGGASGSAAPASGWTDRARSLYESPALRRFVRTVLMAVFSIGAGWIAIRGFSLWARQWAREAARPPVVGTDVIELPPDPYLDPAGVRAGTPPATRP